MKPSTGNINPSLAILRAQLCPTHWLPPSTARQELRRPPASPRPGSGRHVAGRTANGQRHIPSGFLAIKQDRCQFNKRPAFRCFRTNITPGRPSTGIAKPLSGHRERYAQIFGTEHSTPGCRAIQAAPPGSFRPKAGFARSIAPRRSPLIADGTQESTRSSKL